MELVVVGLNHKTAPVEVRERLAFAPTQQEAALVALLRRAAEGVVLSTCNRAEVYAVVQRADAGFQDLVGFLGEFHGLAKESYALHLYCKQGSEAIGHLFAVAAGLDSMICGEPQILGQIRTAYEFSATHHAVGPVLSWAFHHALKVGKQVRSDTNISRKAVSVSYAAVELARRCLGDLAGHAGLVVGAGKMGELTARTLLDNGLSSIVVTNRTYARAAELAASLGGQAAEFARLPNLVAEADVVVTSTGASGFVLTATLVKQAMQARGGRPLLLIDIAVPRDVDPLVQQLDDVSLFNIDDLQAVCAVNLEERQREVARAREIVDAEVEAFEAWWQSLEAVPTISALRQRAERIRQAELQKALGRMGDLTERQRATLEALTSAIVNKLLHQPTTRLKAQSDGRSADRVRALRELFALDEQD